MVTSRVLLHVAVMLGGLCGSARAVKSVRLFVFGDSLVDVGNNNYFPTPFKANFNPYGMDALPRSGRFSNGLVAADFLATRMGIPSPPPFLQPKKSTVKYGVNFASGGAGALSTTFPGAALSLSQQLADFTKYRKQYRIGPKALKHSVVLICIGSNDLFALNLLQPPPPFTLYAGDIASNITSAVKWLYYQGVRKFAVLNVPPAGCAPSARFLSNITGSGCNVLLNAGIQVYNAILARELGMLPRWLKGVTISYVNTYKIVERILQNGNYFGKPVNGSACCGAPAPTNGLVQCGKSRTVNGVTLKATLCSNVKQHVFWDSTHPTQDIHATVTRVAWIGSNQYVRPVTLKTLVNL